MMQKVVDFRYQLGFMGRNLRDHIEVFLKTGIQYTLVESVWNCNHSHDADLYPVGNAEIVAVLDPGLIGFIPPKTSILLA